MAQALVLEVRPARRGQGGRSLHAVLSRDAFAKVKALVPGAELQGAGADECCFLTCPRADDTACLMRLYNTLTRTEEDFAPSRDGVVRMYACGLTVYARGHIGNFRTFTAVDVLRRTLRHVAKLPVHGVMNFTDVDDRTILESNKAGVPLREYTDTYVKAFHEDAATLGLEEIEDRPRATDEANLRAMSDMVAALEQNGHTYRSDGSVYFRIASLPDYGKLARLDHAGIQAGARVDSDKYDKENARDFVLWKATQPDEPTWDFGIGPGRPGWHIECSAMALRILGEAPIDIHCGGIDLVFPHHENEIAQAEGATKRPVLALLVPRRTSADGRREDVEVARQRLQRQGPDRAGPPRRRRCATCCCRCTTASS